MIGFLSAIAWFVRLRNAASKFVGWLFGHPKILLVLIIAIFVGLGVWKARNFVNNLKDQIIILEEAKKDLTEKNEWYNKRVEQLEKDIKEAKEINDQNQRIIEGLEKIRVNLTAIINDLRSKGKQAEGQLEDLRKRIEKMSEESNGPLAEILKEAIKEIEQSRRTR